MSAGCGVPVFDGVARTRSWVAVPPAVIDASPTNTLRTPPLFKDAVGPVTADQLYVNQKISDLISNAEMEQNDYRRGGKPNVFFGLEKRYFEIRFDVFAFNTAVLVGSTLVLLGLLHWILRRQLQVRRS